MISEQHTVTASCSKTLEVKQDLLMTRVFFHLQSKDESKVGKNTLPLAAGSGDRTVKMQDIFAIASDVQ